MWRGSWRQLGRISGALGLRGPATQPCRGPGLHQLARGPCQGALLQPSSGNRRTKPFPVCRFYTTEEDHNKVSYKELKELLDSKAISLIDVREKWEVGKSGGIPGSICIPLGEVAEALQMDPEDFKEKYRQDMPSKSDHLVFSCLAGVRSKQALAAAKSLGFSRVRHYAGGFKEWKDMNLL